jgi:hypothetical protein
MCASARIGGDGGDVVFGHAGGQAWRRCALKCCVAGSVGLGLRDPADRGCGFGAGVESGAVLVELAVAFGDLRCDSGIGSRWLMVLRCGRRTGRGTCVLVAVFAREVTFGAACHSSRQRRGRRRDSGADGRTCRLCDLCGGSVSWGRVSCAGGVAVPRLASLVLHGVRPGVCRWVAGGPGWYLVSRRAPRGRCGRVRRDSVIGSGRAGRRRRRSGDGDGRS